MELFDTHAHLDFPDYAEDFEEVLYRCRENQVVYVVNVGIDIDTSRKSVSMARNNSGIYASVGVHPHDVDGFDERHLRALHLLAADEKVVALGEIGLDYYRDLTPREKQKNAFRRQIALARELGLPVIIHNRDAHKDVLQIIQEENVRDTGGIMHCFSGDWAMAKKCLDNNLLIAVGGTVTFKNAKDVQEVARRIPLDSLLLETDSPYLSPEPRRGKRNEPGNVRFVAEFVAELKKVSVEEVAYWTTHNAFKLFKI
ncbi:MAG TPA: TatD family hydrolase [Clostridia bacterium]|nr:TatD family hydrolase [Clostridia bacterium]